MNKKNIFGALALATVAAFAMTSCDKSKSQVDEKKVESKQAVPSDAKIAYVEVDSIMSQYKFCKDYSLILQKKGQNIQNTLAQKQQALGAAAWMPSWRCRQLPCWCPGARAAAPGPRTASPSCAPPRGMPPCARPLARIPCWRN